MENLSGQSGKYRKSRGENQRLGNSRRQRKSQITVGQGKEHTGGRCVQCGRRLRLSGGVEFSRQRRERDKHCFRNGLEGVGTPDARLESARFRCLRLDLRNSKAAAAASTVWRNSLSELYVSAGFIAENSIPEIDCECRGNRHQQNLSFGSFLRGK